MTVHLVTGGAGFIGSSIVAALASRGDHVRVLDNLCSGFKRNLADLGNVELMEGDVTDPEAVANAVNGVDVVFHQAALASVPLSVENPLATNHACVTGTVNVLDQSRRAGVRRVVYAASSSAYGDSPFCSKREIDLPAPLSPYAVAKLAGEHYCQAFYHTYRLETVCIRYFNVFGPRQDPGSPYSAVIPLFITALLNGNRPKIFGDGKQTRDFTYIENVVHGNLLAMDAPGAVGKTINLADGRSTSLLELLDALNKILGTDVQPIFEEARVGDVRDSLADITNAVELLNYKPVVSFEEGLRKTVEAYQT